MATDESSSRTCLKRKYASLTQDDFGENDSKGSLVAEIGDEDECAIDAVDSPFQRSKAEKESTEHAAFVQVIENAMNKQDEVDDAKEVKNDTNVSVCLFF
jgi:hypothetical protein